MIRRLLARLGYAALGAVYVTLGVTAVQVALEGARDRMRGFAGAFRYLLSRPHGPTIVTGIAAGLGAFVLTRLLDAADGRRSIAQRLAALADALGHGGLAWLAVALLLRLRRGRGVAHSALAWLLSQPWGSAVLETAGAGVIALGAFQLWLGVSGRLRAQLAPRRLGPAAPFAIRVGRFGLAARGVVTAIIGWFLVRAARDGDPGKFHEIGGALDVLRTAHFGSILLSLAGAGLAAYGAYLILLGFLRRVR